MSTSWLWACIILSVYALNTCNAAIDYPLTCSGNQWFGIGCMYLCRCKLGVQCNVSGNCWSNKACVAGNFGPGCQYLDLVYLYGNTSIPLFLRDLNDSTCNTDVNLTNIFIDLTGQHALSWFRVVMKTTFSGAPFSVLLNSRSVCGNEKRLQLNPTTVDVVCENSEGLENVTLFGAGVRDICTVSINGGRNVALKQHANQTSTQNDNIDAGSASNVVHNVNNALSGFCSRTQSQGNPYWQLTYSRPQVINRIKIITKNDGVTRLQHFNVSIHNETNTIHTFLINQAAPASEYTFMSLSPQPSTHVRITQLTQFALRLCNVETYGETVCPDDTWGLACEHDCTCLSNETCSVVNGLCYPQCREGFYGYTCSLPCLEICPNRRCLQRSGFCSKRCVTGFNCSLPCVPSCDQCNTLTGACLVCRTGVPPNCQVPAIVPPSLCPDGKYGSGCMMTCPSGCKDNKCHSTNGSCLACNIGFFLPNCTECNKGAYGLNCAEVCSTLCANNECNITSGVCLACRNGQVHCTACPKGKYGSNCSIDCPGLCKDHVCEAYLGHCFACQGNEKLPLCEEATTSFDLLSYNLTSMLFWLAVMLLLMAIVTILICFIIRKSARDQGKEEESEKMPSAIIAHESASQSTSEISVHESVKGAISENSV